MRMKENIKINLKVMITLSYDMFPHGSCHNQFTAFYPFILLQHLKLKSHYQYCI